MGSEFCCSAPFIVSHSESLFLVSVSSFLVSVSSFLVSVSSFSVSSDPSKETGSEKIPKAIPIR